MAFMYAEIRRSLQSRAGALVRYFSPRNQLLPVPPASFVAGQAVAFECMLHAYEIDDVVAMIFMDAHAPVTKGQVKGVDRISRGESRHDLRMTEEVKGPTG